MRFELAICVSWRSQVLTAAEFGAMAEFAGYKPFLPITWALENVRARLVVTSELDGARAVIYKEFEETAFRLRAHCSQIHNLISWPVPFAYFQLVPLTLVVTQARLSPRPPLRRESAPRTLAPRAHSQARGPYSRKCLRS